MEKKRKSRLERANEIRFGVLCIVVGLIGLFSHDLFNMIVGLIGVGTGIGFIEGGV